MTAFLLATVLAGATGCFGSYLLLRPSTRLQILDFPNERSLHSAPVPRTGGIAIWAGSVGAIAVVLAVGDGRVPLAWIGAAALLVGVISFIDDRSHVPVWARLLAHAGAAGLLLAAGLGLPTIGFLDRGLVPGGIVESLLSMLFVIWMINLYNFMDGMDGFAGGMAVFGFGTLGLLGFLGGDGLFAAVNWAVAAAAAGFLVWNFPPARIFMGDTGSSALGLMAAAMSLWGDKLGLFPFWIAMLVFSPFVVDATVTLIRRAVRGERVWEAHRGHYYQRLVRLGWGHRKTVVLEYVLMAGCSVTAVTLVKASLTAQWLALAAWMLIYAIGVYAVAGWEAAR